MEFYMADGELLCQYPDGSVKPATDSDTDFIREMVATIREWYPGAYNALSECYNRSVNNVPYFHYLMVRRFLKCNFGNLDHTALDIQRTGKFNFEKVHCPLRGECRYEGEICGAKFNSRLSAAEVRVMRLVYDGISNDEIAERLYISPHTVKNHIKSVYLKLGIHEKSEFIQYAHNNNLFND